MLPPSGDQNDKSRITGDCYVRFCEGPGVRFPRATRHSSPAVTHQYLEADLAAKEAVLRRLADPSPAPARFHPGDRLLAFLQDL